MAKTSNGNRKNQTATGMMPGLPNGVATVGKVLKATSGILTAMGLPKVAILPAIMLFAVMLPTLLAPITPILNTALIGYVAYIILRKTNAIEAITTKGKHHMQKQQP